MKYTGTVIEASLLDEAFLNFASIAERKDGIIKFIVDDEFAAAVSEEISKTLRAGSAEVLLQNEYDVFAILPNKVAKRKPS